MTTPYIQDVRKWVEFYSDMARSQELNSDPPQLSKDSDYLAPVEKQVSGEKESVPKTELSVDLISPLRQVIDQAKEEVKEEKNENINENKPVKLASLKKTSKRATSKLYDQLSLHHSQK